MTPQTQAEQNASEYQQIRFEGCTVHIISPEELTTLIQKADALDCVITSFMRASNGYDNNDSKFRWLIELPMTNKEHDTLLSAIQQAQKEQG